MYIRRIGAVLMLVIGFGVVLSAVVHFDHQQQIRSTAMNLCGYGATRNCP
jgi:hypothetical protein